MSYDIHQKKHPYFDFAEKDTNSKLAEEEGLFMHHELEVSFNNDKPFKLGLSKNEATISGLVTVKNDVVRINTISVNTASGQKKYLQLFVLEFSTNFLNNFHFTTKTSELYEVIDILMPFIKHVFFVTYLTKTLLRIEPFEKPSLFQVPEGSIGYAIYGNEVHLNSFAN